MILLIIDMQDDFPAARSKEIVQACRREIWRARKLNASIITITYNDLDRDITPCLPRIEHALTGYNNLVSLSKLQDDGSSEIIESCNGNDLDVSLFRICGVNVDACVKATVTPLIHTYENSRFEFVYEACGCDFTSSVKSGLNLLCFDKPRTRIIYRQKAIV